MIGELRQLHFDFVAFVKFVTEFTNVDASPATVEIALADGFDVAALTEVSSAPSEDLIALVSLGKLLLAELTSELASL